MKENRNEPEGEQVDSPADAGDLLPAASVQTEQDRSYASRAPKAVAIVAIVLFAALLVAVGYGAFALSHPGSASDAAATPKAETTLQQDAASSIGNAETDAKEAHTHDWSIAYKTVHHDAVTHTEHVAPVFQNQTSYHTVCNECKQVIDGKADEHIKATSHSGYSTNVPITDEVMVSAGYDKEVTDTPAYDETVIDKLVCTTCGATKDAPQDASETAN